MKSRTFVYTFLFILLFVFSGSAFATETVKQDVKPDSKVTTTETTTTTADTKASCCPEGAQVKDIKDCTPAEKAACENTAKDGDKNAQKCVTVCIPSPSCCPK